MLSCGSVEWLSKRLDTDLIRLMLRLGFWTLLLSAALPGLKHADVFKDGVNAGSLSLAARLSMQDIANFCPNNPTVCQSGETVAADTLAKAKSEALKAYHGIRTQFDEPDRETATAGIRKE